MFINNVNYTNLNTSSPWLAANFTKSVWREENGTITTAVEGFVDYYTMQHDQTDILCYSAKYQQGDSLWITIRDRPGKFDLVI